MRGDSMLTPPPAHLSPTGLDRVFFVHAGSTLSLTGVTLQNGNISVRLTEKHARGGACSGADNPALICCCFRTAPVAALIPPPPLWCSTVRLMIMVVAPSSSRATWTPRRARSRTMMLYVAGSVLVLRSNTHRLLSPTSPIQLVGGGAVLVYGSAIMTSCDFSGNTVRAAVAGWRQGALNGRGG
jgi:hypothetical protein